MHQSPFVVRTVHSHGAQRKHLLVKGWYDPTFPLIQEEIQFQHYQHLKYLVVYMIGWVNLSEANGHMMYPKGMFHPNWLWCWWDH